MRISLIQLDVKWNDVKSNQDAAEQMILSAEESDLYVLPEMWSTGYATTPLGIAEKDNSSLSWMKRMADRMNAAVAGSVAVESNGKFYNRFYFVKPSNAGNSNEVVYYDKHHLFTYSGEHLSYSAGEKREVVEWRGVRFLLQVCYDLRFPVFSRNASEGADAYDVALYVASWPSTRRMPWDILLRARAIENQCYVCGVNRVGTDNVCQYNGGTAMIDSRGQIVCACDDGKASVVSADIDMNALFAFRKKFPVLNDMDAVATT